MLSKKLRNLVYSLFLVALWASLVLFLSARTDSGGIDPLYSWMMLTILACGFGGLLMLALRLFRMIDKDKNLLYIFFGTANLLIGLLGISLHLVGKINVIGFHDTIPDLLLGTAIIADVFLFETTFVKRDTATKSHEKN